MLSSTLHCTLCLRELLGVFAYSAPEIAHSAPLYVSIASVFRCLWLAAAPRVYFQDLHWRPPALLESVCFIFAQIVRAEGDRISVGSGPRQYIPLCRRPLGSLTGPSPTLFVFFFVVFSTRGTHELMIFQSVALGSAELRREGRSSVSLECPLRLKCPQSKAGHVKKAGTDNLDQ